MVNIQISQTVTRSERVCASIQCPLKSKALPMMIRDLLHDHLSTRAKSACRASASTGFN